MILHKMTVTQLAESLTKLAADVTRIAHEHPEYKVERNELRNYLLLDLADLSIGYVEMGADTVHLWQIMQ